MEREHLSHSISSVKDEAGATYLSSSRFDCQLTDRVTPYFLNFHEEQVFRQPHSPSQ